VVKLKEQLDAMDTSPPAPQAPVDDDYVFWDA